MESALKLAAASIGLAVPIMKLKSYNANKQAGVGPLEKAEGSGLEGQLNFVHDSVGTKHLRKWK